MAKAIGYITVKPSFNDKGHLKEIKIDNAYQKFPSAISVGAVVFKMEIDIPDKVFEPTKIQIFIDEEHILARKPIKIYIVDDTNDS